MKLRAVFVLRADIDGVEVACSHVPSESALTPVLVARHYECGPAPLRKFAKDWLLA